MPETTTTAPAQANTETSTAPTPAVQATTPAPAPATPPVSLLGRQPAVPQSPPAATGGARAPEAVLTAEEINFHFPEGTKPDDALLQKFKPLVRELGLQGDAAQKIVDLYAQRQKALAVEAETQKIRTLNELAEQVRQDPELGGERFEQKMDIARKALRAFGGQELVELLKDSPLANSKPMVRAFYKLGLLMQEDRLDSTGQAAAPSPQKSKDAWRTFYKNTPGPHT